MICRGRWSLGHAEVDAKGRVWLRDVYNDSAADVGTGTSLAHTSSRMKWSAYSRMRSIAGAV